MEFNSQQISGFLRVGLAVGGPLGALIVSKTGMSAAEWSLWLEAILYIVPPGISAVWTWFKNKKSNQILAVKSMPEVGKVVVKDDVGGEIGAMAASADHPDLVTETHNTIQEKEGL